MLLSLTFVSSNLKNSSYDFTVFKQKFDSIVNESWFGTNLMVSLQDITPSMFCNYAKLSHQVDLEIC